MTAPELDLEALELRARGVGPGAMRLSGDTVRALLARLRAAEAERDAGYDALEIRTREWDERDDLRERLDKAEAAFQYFVDSIPGYAEVAGLRARAEAAEAKWAAYEREYILPVFAWAKAMGCDLPALVAEANGNCVERLFGWLRARAEAAEKERDEARDAHVEEVRRLSEATKALRAAEARVRTLETEEHYRIAELRAENAVLRAVAEAARAFRDSLGFVYWVTACENEPEALVERACADLAKLDAALAALPEGGGT